MKHEDWWVKALIGSGVCELGCMYYRWNHISGYPKPPPREEKMISDVESVDVGLGEHVHVSKDHNPFHPTPLVYQGVA